jgi:hypothetical protein
MAYVVPKGRRLPASRLGSDDIELFCGIMAGLNLRRGQSAAAQAINGPTR